MACALPFNNLSFCILSRFAKFIELGQEGIPLGKKAREHFVVHFLGWRKLEFGVVNLLVVFPEAETNVWSGSQTRGAYIANRFALLNPAAYFLSGSKLLHMQVLRR